MIPAILPPLSASSQISPLHGGTPKSFNFQFSIHSPSGVLLLVPEDESGLLEAVQNAKHREPEEHLAAASDLLIQALAASQPSHERQVVRGLTDKDQTLVAILCQRLATSSPGLILLPEIHPLEAQDVVHHSPSQIICEPGSILAVRHLLEHARDLDSFLHGLRQILGNESICLIEVPDSSGLFTCGDLTQLWEEHTVYFTASSLHRALRNMGFEILAHQNMISNGEELCMAVVRRSEHVSSQQDEKSTDSSAIEFLFRLPNQLQRIKSSLATLASERTIYIFGANHIAGLFLDLISDGAKYIDRVIDEDPDKVSCSIGLLCTPIDPLESIDQSRPVHLLVAVNEGRAPELYERLQILLPESNGHRVESLVSLSLKCWETI